MKCIILFDGSVLGITLVLTGTDQLSDYANRKMEGKNYLCSESTPDAKKQTLAFYEVNLWFSSVPTITYLHSHSINKQKIFIPARKLSCFVSYDKLLSMCILCNFKTNFLFMKKYVERKKLFVLTYLLIL